MKRERKRVNSSDIKPVTPKNTSVMAAVRVSSLFSNLYKRIKVLAVVRIWFLF
jgi:hypothetical protein